MTTPIISPAMRRKAERLAEALPFLPRGRSKETGQAFYVVPSTTAPLLVAHWTELDGTGCTSIGFDRRGVCTHSIAAGIVARAARQVAGAAHTATSSPTSWRPCSRQCGELLAPEHRYRMCDGCFSKARRLLDAAAA
jgi:hypothetical protein